MKSLAAMRICYGDDPINMAADLSSKERRKLVCMVKETPFSGVHLENMLSLTREGVVMFPPAPAWYTRPESLGEAEDQSIDRMLDIFHLDTGEFERWVGSNNK